MGFQEARGPARNRPVDEARDDARANHNDGWL